MSFICLHCSLWTCLIDPSGMFNFDSEQVSTCITAESDIRIILMEKAILS